MINKNELRIGSAVLDPDGEVSLITGINLEWELGKSNYYLKNGYNGAFEDIAPIPLTEDILLQKCKAIFTGSEWQIEYEDTTFIFEGNLEDGYYYTGGEGCKLSRYFYNLHELQNMFHSIMGEQLNVEL